MKKLLFAMAAVLSLLVSCGKENKDEDYGLFKEPILTWGASQADIISQLGTPETQTDDLLKYINEKDNVEYFYHFWDNKLDNSMVFLPYAISFEDIIAFLKEKYVYRDEFSGEDHAYFDTKDGKNTILAEPDVMGARGIAYSKNDGDLL